MRLKEIIKEFFDLDKKTINDFSETIKQNKSTLRSFHWTSDSCRKIRLCELEIEDKFYAESLVIYPDVFLDSPIFGTEYLNIGNKKYFGVIDFHPISENQEYYQFLDIFPNKKVEKSKIYNLNLFFSEKIWLQKRKTDFYNEYQIMTKCYLHQYKKCLKNSKKSNHSLLKKHEEYNHYMSKSDPAFGILKHYFNKNFSDSYIHNFLFSSKYIQ